MNSAYRPPTRVHTHTNTHTHTQKTLWVVFPVSSLRQTINTKEETDFTSETLSSFSTNIGAPLYDQVCIIIHPYQHRRMSGFLSFCRLNCILSLRDPIFFEHVHLEWTYSQVPSRVYYSSGVGLRLLVRLEKSLITKGPLRYCDLRQDTCLFGHGRVDPARTKVNPGVFGAFLHCDKCDKNRHRHLVPVYGT